jgi:beta-galactosidase
MNVGLWVACLTVTTNMQTPCLALEASSYDCPHMNFLSTLASVIAFIALTLPAVAQPTPHTAKLTPHTFVASGDHFTLDGKPFKIISGELHYARIPREYWHARLKMARAMGLNTVATYVFWNVHEPAPGQYDFTGQYDLAAFIRAAQQEGLYVILRSGPYACAEWDLGGLPAWLLVSPESAQAIRTNSPLFMQPAQRWITRLAKEVLPLQVGRGGPILMTQMENEYGLYGDDHAYIAHLRDIYTGLGFTDSLLYTADNWRYIPQGSIPGTFASVNFGVRNHQGGMDALARARPEQALFVSEYWPGWFDHWGHPHETRPIAPQIEDIDYILHRGAGINIYMFHGGTSFGFYSGSSLLKDKFLPDVTSYDYDAPLDESGRPTPKYFAYRKELAKFSPCGDESCLPPVPASTPAINIPDLFLTKATPLFDNLPRPIASALPAPMEHFGQDFGYILYRTQLPQPVHGGLILKDVHDFAAVYLDGILQGTLDRRNAAPDGTLPPIRIDTTAPSRLDILVANDGRVNVDHTMTGETKGITQFVAIDGRPLGDWQVYPLTMQSPPTPQQFEAATNSVTQNTSVFFSCDSSDRPIWSECPPRQPSRPISLPPAFFRAHFTLNTPGDTFLDTRHLGKGVVFINGHNVGRFWSVGPQATLYLPGPWLRKGLNEIVVFDMLPNAHESVAGLDHPILDQPVSDKTVSDQQ